MFIFFYTWAPGWSGSLDAKSSLEHTERPVVDVSNNSLENTK